MSKIVLKIDGFNKETGHYIFTKCSYDSNNKSNYTRHLKSAEQKK